MTTIGIIGAGRIGSQIARLAVENDYDVVISNSRGPETLSALIAELGPKARAATAVEAAKAGDIVVVTVPLRNYRKVPVEPLAGSPRRATTHHLWPSGASGLPPQQLRRLGEVRRQPPRFVPGQQLGRRAPTGLVLEVEIPERLPGGVLHDEARIVVLLDDPRRREAARERYGAATR
ncbi:MAG: NAD(P)-binding domain-containing protein [Beijerinckiaceae bacterium]